MKLQSISRREFLKTSAATVAFAAITSPNLFAAESYGGNKIPFALQLYSVRNECAKDLDGTVKAVAKMGYKAVEFAGYHGRDSKTLPRLWRQASTRTTRDASFVRSRSRSSGATGHRRPRARY